MKKSAIILIFGLIMSFASPALAADVSSDPGYANVAETFNCDNPADFIFVWAGSPFVSTPTPPDTLAVLNSTIYQGSCSDAANTGVILDLGSYQFLELRSNDPSSLVYPDDFSNGSTFNVVVKIPGCMEPTAMNFNPTATFDDGSCAFNLTELINQITIAQNLLAQSTEGAKHGQYLAGSRATLQTWVNAAIDVRDFSASDQPNVDTVTQLLKVQIADFRAGQVPTPDTSALNTLILSAQSLYDTATEGTSHGQYVPGSRALLVPAIDVAIASRGSQTNTQNDVDNAVQALTQAVSVFQSKLIHPPVIKAHGDLVMTIFVGGAFTDPGATAFDELDGDFPVSVGGDTVDTTTTGTYHISYDAVDSAGNQAVQVIRTVIVLQQPPIISGGPPAIVLTSPSNLLSAPGLSQPLVGKVLGAATDQHPIGSLILNGKTVYVVTDTQIRPFATEQEFYSYGYTFSSVAAAYPEDMKLPIGEIMPAADGTLALDSGTIYQVTGGVKHPFTVMAQFTALGYSLAHVRQIDLARYPLGGVMK